MPPHGIPFQELEIIRRTIDIKKDHVQMPFCIFLLCHQNPVNALKRATRIQFAYPIQEPIQYFVHLL